jgi:hypothetical protein
MKRKINEMLSRHRGPAYTGNRIMGAALTLFAHFFIIYFGDRDGDFVNFQLASLYQAATEILQDPALSENATNIMQRFLFVLRTMHTVHYAYFIFPTQFERRLTVGMSLHERLGRVSIMSRLDESLIRTIALLNNVDNVGDFELLKDRWEEFFQDEGRINQHSAA